MATVFDSIADLIGDLKSTLEAERESHAAQVSAMLEERDQLQGMVEIAKATLVYKEAMAAALGASTTSPSWGAARNAADILDATIARVRQ